MAREATVPIINASRTTALTCFPRMELEACWLNLRHNLPERRSAFERGLELAAGLFGPRRLADRVVAGDVLVTWNVIREARPAVDRCESLGVPVLVAENASWGTAAGERWLTVARGRHNTAWRFPVGGHDRFDALGVDLAPFRAAGDGDPPAARHRARRARRCRRTGPRALKRYGRRIRSIPGSATVCAAGARLANAGRVVTWGNGAAIKALQWGIPVVSEMPDWIGEQDNTDAGGWRCSAGRMGTVDAEKSRMANRSPASSLEQFEQDFVRPRPGGP